MLIVVSIFIFENSLMVRYRLWSAFRCYFRSFQFYNDGADKERTNTSTSSGQMSQKSPSVLPYGYDGEVQ